MLKYDTIENVIKRAEELLADPLVLMMAKDYYNHTPDFNDRLKIAKKIADIDIKGIKIDDSKFNGKSFFTDKFKQIFPLFT